MKCTSKSERRRQRNKNLLMGMGVVIVVLLIVLAVVLIKQKDASMPISFDLTTEVFGQTVEEEALTADGLAADLCVGAGDTALDGVETQGDERAALFDIQNKTLLFSKSLYEKSYPASITKIMTALVAMEHADMDEVVTITASDVALSADSQVCGLAEGDQIQMSELFHALLVYSANDAAMAIARTVGDGSVDTFVQLLPRVDSLFKEAENQIEKLGNTDIDSISSTVRNIVDDNKSLFSKSFAEDVVAALSSQPGTAIDVYLALNEIVENYIASR